ncbi:hypothetical protein [Paenibacillus sonchi]|nr:hypothetical protein [Paenibacillus sonchi]MCE3198534.1 hypothetical protein [Paenibacillus sonchi]
MKKKNMAIQKGPFRLTGMPVTIFLAEKDAVPLMEADRLFLLAQKRMEITND